MHGFQVYKEFFPDIAVGYEDPRVALHVKDGKMKLKKKYNGNFSLFKNKRKETENKFVY